MHIIFEAYEANQEQNVMGKAQQDPASVTSEVSSYT